VLGRNVDLARKTIRSAAAVLNSQRDCDCASALKDAIITDRSRIPRKTKTDLAPIIGKYF
jgi:5'-methylthioadenosine phosphorylase